MSSPSSFGTSFEGGEGGPAGRRVAAESVLGDSSSPGFDLPSVGPHVFYDGVFFAKEGETIAQLIRRVRGGELANFRWMLPSCLIEELESPSGVDRCGSSS